MAFWHSHQWSHQRAGARPHPYGWWLCPSTLGHLQRLHALRSIHTDQNRWVAELLGLSVHAQCYGFAARRWKMLGPGEHTIFAKTCQNVWSLDNLGLHHPGLAGDHVGPFRGMSTRMVFAHVQYLRTVFSHLPKSFRVRHRFRQIFKSMVVGMHMPSPRVSTVSLLLLHVASKASMP